MDAKTWMLATGDGLRAIYYASLDECTIVGSDEGQQVVLGTLDATVCSAFERASALGLAGRFDEQASVILCEENICTRHIIDVRTWQISQGESIQVSERVEVAATYCARLACSALDVILEAGNSTPETDFEIWAARFGPVVP